MRRLISICCLSIIALSAAGCLPSQANQVVRYEANSQTIPASLTVSQKGYYALYPGNGINPLESVYLNPGDQYGFVTHEGKIVGTYTKAGKAGYVPLDAILALDYVWKFDGETAH